MGRCRTAALLPLLLVCVFSASALSAAVQEEHEVVPVTDAHAPGEIITIKLRPAVKRKKEDARALADRLKTLPELQGASLAAVSRDLLVLTPSPKQQADQVTQLLLQQPDVYEVEIGEQQFRRDDDKPYDQLRKDMLSEAVSSTKSRIRERIKNKLRALAGRLKPSSSGPAGPQAPAAAVSSGPGDSVNSGGSPEGRESRQGERQRKKPAAGRGAKRGIRGGKRRGMKRRREVGSGGGEGANGEL
ncbi:hypothetical protein Agub_g8781 [Astrephomene gubernaculifera]|uniref:Uncharacterized protein n=1 Tax=Astrephomene gubernaculifera TaxID=47775 RepID=A0AAD3DSQ6_9CHLO|nr:hypothetical protein Agub_g8781 [Astrephomene gubernaculifera]